MVHKNKGEPMKRIIVRCMAIVLWLIGVAMFGFIAVLPLLKPGIKLQNDDPMIGIAMLGITTVGALVAVRRPLQPIGWILLVIGLCALLSGFSMAIVNWVASQDTAAPVTKVLAIWLTGWTWILALGLLISFLLLLYPTGHLPNRHWRLIGWLEGIWLGTVTILAAYGPGDGGAPNPLALPALRQIPIEPFLLLGIPVLVIGVVAQIKRFRTGTPAERQQLKWLLYPTALFAGVSILDAIAPAIGLALVPFYAKIYDIIIGIIYLLFPLAFGVAILRYRLFDIDLIIRKTLIYTALTATLALVFFGGVALLQQVVGRLTGTENSPIAIVISTLLIAALFTPLRRRIQDFIDRRFYRQKYNAEQALADFAATARDETDLEALTGKLVEVVSQTMQPERVSLWMRPGKKA
jgi:hypothetical protein